MQCLKKAGKVHMQPTLLHYVNDEYPAPQTHPCPCVPYLRSLNPNIPARRKISRDTELGDLPHLALRLLADLVRHPPPEADGLDLLVLVAGVVHDDGLLHARELAGEKAPPRLWL